MDNPTDEFMQTLMGKIVAVTTNNDRILHGVLLAVGRSGVVLGMGKFKDPRPVGREFITKMYLLGDEKYPTPGMVRAIAC